MTTIQRTICQAALTIAAVIFLSPPAIAEASLDGKDTIHQGNQGSNEAKTKVDVSATTKGLVLETGDGQFKFAFGGRLQFDAGAFLQDETKLGNGSEIRRGRIKSYGTVWTNWDYKLEVNFDPDLAVPITDGWLRYSGCECFSVTLGHQKVPFGQSTMTSSNWQVFQERALADAFIDTSELGRRRLGMVIASHGEMWSYAGGVFSGGLGDSGAKDEDFGSSHRFIFTPIAEKTKVVVIGGSAAYRRFNSQSDLRFRARPEAHVSGARLVDTGVLSASKESFKFNAEASVVAGPFHGQAEYTSTRIRRGMGRQNLVLSGLYVQAGVFLTGESRNFNQKSGKYKRVTPKSEKFGAWEVAARFSQIDLTDRSFRGGVQRDVTVGLNWWANANVLFRLNYIYANASPNSDIELTGRNERVHAFTGRAQVVF